MMTEIQKAIAKAKSLVSSHLLKHCHALEAEEDAIQALIVFAEQSLQGSVKFLSDKEVEKILKTTIIGYYHPIAIKGEPVPKPRPLYIHDYRIDLGGVYRLVSAFSGKVLRKEGK